MLIEFVVWAWGEHFGCNIQKCALLERVAFNELEIKLPLYGDIITDRISLMEKLSLGILKKQPSEGAYLFRRLGSYWHKMSKRPWVRAEDSCHLIMSVSSCARGALA